MYHNIATFETRTYLFYCFFSSQLSEYSAWPKSEISANELLKFFAIIYLAATVIVHYTTIGTGVVFHGTLSTAIPQEGKATHTGYCAIRSKPLKVHIVCFYNTVQKHKANLQLQPSWFDVGTIDLSEYDEFELRVRGDGRRFIANLQYPGLARKDDVWQCFVFTRGGPEWEAIRVSMHMWTSWDDVSPTFTPSYVLTQHTHTHTASIFRVLPNTPRVHARQAILVPTL